MATTVMTRFLYGRNSGEAYWEDSGLFPYKVEVRMSAVAKVLCSWTVEVFHMLVQIGGLGSRPGCPHGTTRAPPHLERVLPGRSSSHVCDT